MKLMGRKVVFVLCMALLLGSTSMAFCKAKQDPCTSFRGWQVFAFLKTDILSMKTVKSKEQTKIYVTLAKPVSYNFGQFTRINAHKKMAFIDNKGALLAVVPYTSSFHTLCPSCRVLSIATIRDPLGQKFVITTTAPWPAM